MTKPLVRVTSTPISVEGLLNAVATDDAGGTAVFIGTVRNRSGRSKVTRMQIEAAEELARGDLERIAHQASKRFEVARVAIAHRTGLLKVGEIIVFIAVSAPHRADAFAACRYIIDELKKTTPIWKKERAGGRDRWVR